jgi:hypothetical protein
MLRKIFLGTTGILCFLTTFSQTDSSKKAPATTFVFSLDAYYRYDFNNVSGVTNNLISFTNSKNSFELGMASVRADHSFGKVAATIDLGFGRRAEEFSYNDGQYPTNSQYPQKNGFVTMAAIKQAYVSYAPSSKIKFTVGKWATHIGYELLDAYANRNYSMSYGFSYGPFFHTGLKADISVGGKTAFMVGVANPTDFSTTTSDTKVALAQLSTGTKNDKLKAFLNFQGGDNISQFDLVLNGIISSQFAINYDGTIVTRKTAGKSNSWNSNALYFNYDPTAKFGLTLRGEYFDDDKSVAGIGISIFQTTLSGNIHLDNLTLIPEIRLDNAKNNIFYKSASALPTSKSDASFILAAVYKF